MGEQSTNRQNKNRGKIAERIAFDPFLPKEDLINEFIRNTINPNTDQGQTYYVGKIIDIIENSDAIIDNRDIFYNQSDNYERIVRASNDKKYNQDRKVLIVHVPSFLTGAAYSARTKNLNYDMFTKLRVEYRGKDEVRVGYIVKIQFGNTERYTEPEIISVIPAEASYIDILSKPALEAHRKYEECVTLNLKSPVDIGQQDITPFIKPPGGYSQALKELKNVFSKSYIDSFISTIKIAGPQETQFGKIENIILNAIKISVDPKVYTEYSQKLNLSFLASNSFPENKYLIRGELINIACEKPENNDQLRNKFFNYIKADFDSRLSFLFSYNNQPNDNSFVLDINLNLLEQKGNEAKTVDNYLKISKIFDELNYFPFSNTSSGQTEQQTEKTIIKPKTIVDKCEAELAKDKTIYPIIYDGKSFTNTKAISEKNIIEQYYKIPLNNSEQLENFTNQYLTLDYFNKLINTNSAGLRSKNSKFYLEGQGIEDKYGDSKKSIGISALLKNQQRLIDFLKALKNQINILEKYGANSGRILIVPFQVLKIKKTVPEKGNDPNSRHYYGKAFDIRVFLKDFDERDPKKQVVKQIRPEIITLYANLVAETTNNKIGQGLFLEETKRYNHIEFLENPQQMGLSEEEYNERLLYTTSVDDPLGKILKESGASDRIFILKNQIRQNPIYRSTNGGLLDPRFRELTLPST